MNAKQRILSIRIQEREKTNEEYIKSLGIVTHNVVVKEKVSETRTVKTKDKK